MTNLQRISAFYHHNVNIVCLHTMKFVCNFKSNVLFDISQCFRSSYTRQLEDRTNYHIMNNYIIIKGAITHNVNIVCLHTMYDLC
jgi:hypothetical protein